jgi:hypothetical protein
MATSGEVGATTWSAGDEAFFRMVAWLFPPAFVLGAGVVLASYDGDALVDGAHVRSPQVPRAPVRRRVPSL